MPVTLTYPGVYIEELPSGVRTITGVATSITAFIGRAIQGPVSEPITITNFGDFERTFGGLWLKGPMSYAVRDFFLNGGSQAIIVRLFSDADQKATKKATSDLLKAIQEAAEKDDATVATVKTAAQSSATELKNKETNQEAKKALDAILTATQAVDDAQSAEDALKAATDASKTALAAVPSPVASLDIPLGGRDAAVAVHDAATGDDPAAVATAARQKADTYKAEPDKSAADAIAKAAEAAKDVQDATADSVKNAVKTALGKVPVSFTLNAASPGKWSDNLKIVVNYDGIDAEVAKRYGLAPTDLFNLSVTDGAGSIERIRNVSVVESSRRLDRVLLQESQLIRVPIDEFNAPVLPAVIPSEQETSVTTKGKKSGPLAVTDYKGSKDDKTGIYALDKADLFNLLCIPPDYRDGDTHVDVYGEAMKYCKDQRAMLIVDPPAAWGVNKETAAAAAKDGLRDLGLSGEAARNAALYFPRVVQSDPLRENQMDTFVPCGIIAGVMSRTDTQRGVWKAPAGIDAAVSGVRGLQVNLSDAENGLLNPLGINCLRSFPVYGRVVWGARTLRGADQLADEYKYVPVRRLLLFLEESLFRGTQWVVFEPNDEPLWAQIRLNLGAFMNNLFRQGAFQGSSPKEAYFVKCDKETTTQNDINLGIVNIVIGFAPLKPAEFVILKFQQIAGDIAT